jgi:glutamate racemase
MFSVDRPFEPGFVMPHDNRPIGVFDSGLGGLTVLRALRARLPRESMLYLGDTARLPYGTKSEETVQRYARQAAGALIHRGVKLLVIACNTASAYALDHLRMACFPVPVLGVVDPGAEAACAASRSGRIGVLSTEATANSGAYETAIRARRPGAVVTSIACPLLVAMAEEGWTEGPVPEAVIRRYLEPVLHRADSPDCFVLGCTHFPLLKGAIQNVAGPAWPLIDSGFCAAQGVDGLLSGGGLSASETSHPRTRFLVTDGPARFTRLASEFFGSPVAAADVDQVDLREVALPEPIAAPAA